MDTLTITTTKTLALTLGIALIFIGDINSTVAATKDSTIKVIKVPRYPAKPGISPSLSHFQRLPNLSIVKKISPDKKYLAQVVRANKAPVYYLAVVNLKNGGKIIVHEPLIVGDEYPYKKIHLFWKNLNTIIIKAKHRSGKKRLALQFNIKTIKLSRSEEAIKAKLKVKTRKRLKPESLSHVYLKTLEQRMMLHKQIPLGVTYDALKKNMPELSDLKAIPKKPDTTWAILYIDALGSKAEVKFTFKNGILHDFFYAFPATEDKYAKINYKKLQDYYSQFYGKYKEEFIEEEPGRSAVESTWESDKGSVIVSRMISWGRATIWWFVKY